MLAGCVKSTWRLSATPAVPIIPGLICSYLIQRDVGGSLMRISVVGLGKLGAPLLAVLASRGFEVCGIDLNQSLVDQVNNGVAPVLEPHLQGC